MTSEIQEVDYLQNIASKVSVIVPICNAGHYLDQALNSLTNQTYDNLEIICLNDGSTDDSLSIMQKHAVTDSRIVVIDKPNEGYGATCNRGIDMATGEWIAILEPDDWIEPGMFADMLAFETSFVGERPIDVIKTPYWVIRNPDTPEELKLNCSYRGRVKPKVQPFVIHDAPHLLGHHPSIWSAIYRKSFLDDFGIRFKEIPGAGWADNPFLVETLCQARGIVYLPKAYYCYREETPEKAIALAERSPLLPFERWQDMADALDRIGVDDPVIWTQMITRGFTYMSGVIEFTGLKERNDLDEAVRAMFLRMDPNLVFANPRVSPACKRLFAEYRGIDDPPVSEVQHVADLVSEGIYNIWNMGPKQTFKMVRTYISRYNARSGKSKIKC